MDTIGARIRAARKAKGLTMKQLHDLTGLSTGNISDIENERYTPSVAALVPLKQALGCSVDWLLSGNTDDTPISEQAASCDDIPLSQMERDVVAMLRLLNPHDRKNAVDFITMLYEQATGKKGSIYSTYIEDEYRQTSGPAEGGSESVIA
jgi:transcriptional regulator with XRE-family HTH domain